MSYHALGEETPAQPPPPRSNDNPTLVAAGFVFVIVLGAAAMAYSAYAMWEDGQYKPPSEDDELYYGHVLPRPWLRQRAHLSANAILVGVPRAWLHQQKSRSR